MNDVVNAIEMHGSGPPSVTVSFHGLPLKTNKIMASTVKERATWNGKSVTTAEGSEKENAMHIRREGFATSHAPSLWTGSIPAGKLGCHFRSVGRFGFKGSGSNG